MMKKENGGNAIMETEGVSGTVFFELDCSPMACGTKSRVATCGTCGTKIRCQIDFFGDLLRSVLCTALSIV